jgi:hypothetical protein
MLGVGVVMMVVVAVMGEVDWYEMEKKDGVRERL